MQWEVHLICGNEERIEALSMPALEMSGAARSTEIYERLTFYLRKNGILSPTQTFAREAAEENLSVEIWRTVGIILIHVNGDCKAKYPQKKWIPYETSKKLLLAQAANKGFLTLSTALFVYWFMRIPRFQSNIKLLKKTGIDRSSDASGDFLDVRKNGKRVKVRFSLIRLVKLLLFADAADENFTWAELVEAIEIIRRFAAPDILVLTKGEGKIPEGFQELSETEIWKCQTRLGCTKPNLKNLRFLPLP
jgi:hypothetical protein